MTKKEGDTRCQIEVESKAGSIIKVSVLATNETECFKLFKQVRAEIAKK